MSIRPVGPDYPVEGAPLIAADNGVARTADVTKTVVRNMTVSTSSPTGGADGDVWLKYTP